MWILPAGGGGAVVEEAVSPNMAFESLVSLDKTRFFLSSTMSSFFTASFLLLGVDELVSFAGKAEEEASGMVIRESED